MKNKILKKIHQILIEYEFNNNFDFEEITNLCLEDLQAFSAKDPSSNNDMNYIFETYISFLAVLYYRIAHKLFTTGNHYIARLISENCKILTGIEIHPAANIGKRFVIDHGIGTVIGETTTIGDDCYILQCVILGALHIANNTKNKRHPIIGNNVEIGSYTKIFGPVIIKDNTKISPGSIIRNNIPSNSKVLSIGIIQIVLNKTFIKLLGYQKKENNSIIFYFSNLNEIINKNIKISFNNVLIKNWNKVENNLILYNISNLDSLNEYVIYFINLTEFRIKI